jgi:predicted ferric reductase
LQETPAPKVFIATGTGLAPIYNMITTLPTEVSKSLYFTVATEAELFYIEKLRQIPNLDLHIHVSREEIE